MIIEIPNKSDFFQSGLSILNLAWGAVAAFYIDLEYSELEEWDEDGAMTEDYWQAAQQPISIALALAQQGIELLLKGRISEISPFLLLAGNPRDWPASCSDKDTPFADFRTIEAHELIRCHDTVIADRLTESFKTQFERLRRLRNIIFHSVDKKSRPTAEDVFRVILESIDCLYHPKGWVRIRREYLEKSPKSIAYSSPEPEVYLISELLHIVRLLKPSEAKRYLGFNKKQRAYICYECASKSSDIDLQPRIATLDPNTPKSTRVYCFVCDRHYPVIRKDCTQDDCPGNVIDAKEGVCLTCYK